jgi:hypothetical protein
LRTFYIYIQCSFDGVSRELGLGTFRTDSEQEAVEQALPNAKELMDEYSSSKDRNKYLYIFSQDITDIGYPTYPRIGGARR